MTTPKGSGAPIPVICADPSTVAGANIFNPNEWSAVSKGLVQSCWTEYSVLHHCVGQISHMCAASHTLAQPHAEMIQQQWRTGPFNLTRVAIYGQVPDLHIRIAAFFAGLKALLDLLAQLLSTEKIVSAGVHGFHRVGTTNYGGKVLNALDHNCLADRKDVGARVRSLIVEHKMLWIDQAIGARDQLVHPDKGMHQLMFHLEFVQDGQDVRCERVNAPKIGAEHIDQYAQRMLQQVGVFSSHLLGLLRGGATSNLGMEPTR